MGGVEAHVETVAVAGGAIEVSVRGDGPAIVLIPSLGRAAGDFADLASRLARAGYRAVCPEPRGIGGSTAPTAGMSMRTLAADVAEIVKATAGAPRATVAGHAFGNRVARMVATVHPELVDGVILLAAGGLVPPTPEVASALRAVFDVSLPANGHIDAVRTAFFAPGNDASVWRDGWYSDVAAAQSTATIETDVRQWWTAGRAPVLVLQPADDVVALPANAEQLAAELGDRAEVVTIANAGHALLPEQPAAVAAAMINWLEQRRA